MKVRELIEQLKSLDQEKEIFIWYDTYAFIEPEIETFNAEGSNDEEEIRHHGCYIMSAG